MSAPKTTGSKIPIKKVVVAGLVLIATILVNSMAKMEGFSPRLTAWTTLISFVVFSLAGYKLAWEHKSHGHGHGMSMLDWAKVFVLIAIGLFIIVRLGGWLWSQSTGVKRETYKAKEEARRELLTELEKVLPQQGSTEQIQAPLVDISSVPNESRSNPSGFSREFILSRGDRWEFNSIGNMDGPLLVWDGRKVHVYREDDEKNGKTNRITKPTSLSFATWRMDSNTISPNKVEVKILHR